MFFGQSNLTTMVDGVVVFPTFPFAQQVPVPDADLVETIQAEGSATVDIAGGAVVDSPG